MRSFAIWLALTAPMYALNSSPTSTTASPLSTPSSSVVRSSADNGQKVTVAFFNSTLRPYDLHVGKESYTVPSWQTVKLRISVGSPVLVDSVMVRRPAQTLLQVSASDQGRTVTIQ